jgi:Nuclease-related domain
LISAQSRISAEHPIRSVLSAKQASKEAGIGGEERVADVFRKHPFSSENHIFHDLSPFSDEKFQIDTYFMNPYSSFVFEVKNIGGVLEFRDNPPQLVRTKDNGQKDGFESPVVQLERNRELLSEWLKRRNIYLPIYGAVVLAYPKQIVAVPPAKTKLLFPNLIPSYLKSIPQQGKKLDTATFNWLSAELLNSHQPFIPKPICEAYNIPFSDIKTGVKCEVCGRIGMIKISRTWHCPNCKENNNKAHIKTLQEYFLLIKRSITNRECRDFLHINDIQTAKRILQSMNLKSEGNYRYRSYILDFHHIFQYQPKSIFN